MTFSADDTVMSGEIVTLVFNNADARPHNVALRVDSGSVPHIMAWYGAYFAGDRYTVAVNGRNVHMDANGEPIDHPVVT